MTPLDKTLKRSLNVNGIEYVVTLSPEALKLTRKGRRLGMELKWADITSGESALAVALHASVGRFDPDIDEKGATTERGVTNQKGAKTEKSTKAAKRAKTEERPKDMAAAERGVPCAARRGRPRSELPVV
jgi:hypothetical protein